LSKSVIAPSGCRRASCCQANLAPGPNLNVLFFPPEAPHDLPGAAVELVDRRGVPRGDEDAAVGVDLGRVDVEVVIRVLARALVLRDRQVGLRERHLGQAVPLEEHATTRDRQLLDDSLEDVAVTRATELAEVGGNRPVDRHQRDAAWQDPELVDVAGEAVAGADDLDQPVGGIEDVVAAGEPDASHADAALPPGQDGPALVALHLEVGDAGGRQGLEPDDLPAVVEDHRPRLLGSSFRRDEDVPLGRPPGRAENRHPGRLEVRAADEVLHGLRRRRRRRRLRGAAAAAGVEREPDGERDRRYADDPTWDQHPPEPAHRDACFQTRYQSGVT
jgi:hypothetical protein